MSVTAQMMLESTDLHSDENLLQVTGKVFHLNDLLAQLAPASGQFILEKHMWSHHTPAQVGGADQTCMNL